MNDYELSYFIKSGVYVYASARVDDGRLEFSTGVKFPKKPEEGKEYKISDLERKDLRKLERARLDYDAHVGNCEKSNTRILKAECKEIIIASIGGKLLNKQVLTLGQLITNFIAGATSGAILNDKEKRFPESSIELMKYAEKAAMYTKLDKIPVNELQGKDFKRFRSILTNKPKKDYAKNKKTGLSANTIMTYNNVLLLMITGGRKLGWHKNSMDEDTGITRAKGEDVDYAIAYTEAELLKLYRHDFKNKRKEATRDVFVFGCFTCLRHSDYYLTDYKMSLMEGNILHLISLKTDNTLYIPLHPVALEIYNKYKGNIPMISYSTLLLNSKNIAREAGFDTPCLFSRIEGGVRAKEHRPKWKLTTPHTMRRTFATNAFISGMPERMIMKIGGWKSYSAFERYLRLSGVDIAKLAMAQPFYKDWKW